MRHLTNKKILISPSQFAEFDSTPLNELRKSGYEITVNPFGRRLTKKEIMELLKNDVIGTIAGVEPLDEEVLRKSKLKVISRCGSGMSNVDLHAAKKLNITVCSTPSAPVTSVAELTIGAMLNLLRHISQMDREMHSGNWAKMTGHLLEGKAMLIIGFGQIGQKVAKLLKPFGVKLMIHDPFIKKNTGGIKNLSLEKALPQADIVTCHCSGENEVIGDKEFSLMKKGVYLLNAARGETINEKALIASLQSGKIKGAWLDTFGREPYDGSLKQFAQVILTPHIGSYTVECRKNMELEAVRNLIEALERK